MEYIVVISRISFYFICTHSYTCNNYIDLDVVAS